MELSKPIYRLAYHPKSRLPWTVEIRTGKTIFGKEIWESIHSYCTQEEAEIELAKHREVSNIPVII